MAGNGERLVFRNSVGRAFRAALFPLLLVVLFGLFLGFVVSFGGGPVDYVFVGFMLAVGVLAGVLLFLPGFVRGRRRNAAVLTPEGLPPRRIAWRDVTGVGTVWHGYGRLVGVALRGGRRILLPAPIGARWRPDPRFVSHLKTIQRYAAARGAATGGRVPGRWRAPVIVALLLIAMTAGVGAAVVVRGVVLPWQPVAVAAPAACAALKAAGLDRHWPEASRRMRAAGPERTADASLSDCYVEPNVEALEPAAYRGMSAHLIAWRTRYLSSGPATARYELHRERQKPGAARLAGLGDEAVSRVNGALAIVLVRRANLTVRVSLLSAEPKASAATIRAARELAAGVLQRVRIGPRAA